MKISKKILGVALALIMIFNVFAVGTFAAFPDDAVVKLQVTADKAVYAPGDVITLTVSEQVIPEVGDMLIGGQYDFGYNGAAIELLSNDTETLESHGFVAIAAGYDAGISGVQLPSQSGVSEINGWTDAVTFNVGYDGTPFDATSMTDLFTVQFKVKADAADGTYVIGFNPAGYEGYSAYSADAANEGLYGPFGADYGYAQENMYEYGTCEIKVSSGSTVSFDANGGTGTMADVTVSTGSYVLPECGFTAPDKYVFSAWDVNGTEYAPGTTIPVTADTTVKAVWARQIIVTHAGTQAKYRPNVAKAENYIFGFVGNVDGLTPETEKNSDNRDVVTNIQSITAVASYNGTTVTSDVITMWAEGDGTYGFRAVFSGFDYLDTKEVTVNFVITMADGTTTYTTANTATDSANGIYTAAVGRGMPAIA